MPRSTPVEVVNELATRGYNAEREAVTLLARADDLEDAIERATETVPDEALTLSADDVAAVVRTADATGSSPGHTDGSSPDTRSGSPATDSDGSGDSATTPAETPDQPPSNPSVSSGTATHENDRRTDSPLETKGSGRDEAAGERTTERSVDPDLRSLDVQGDVTGRSTGTGEYADFVATFRDRYERLSGLLRSRVNHRPTEAVDAMAGGSDAAIVGMIADIRSTANGHWLVELEDTTGTFPCLILKDREIASVVDELLLDELVAVEGTLAGDGGILFVDELHFPDVPRTYRPSTADRHVRAALISDVHVGSQEFANEAWSAFADWLHTEDAAAVEYLLVAGDMVEGVGVYPDQDEELDIVDIYEQYEAFAERLKEVPGDMEILLTPGNHDAVRLAEPQPGFDEELREIMSVHDARFSGNPSTVTIEGVTILMYHGVSLDEVIAELPEEKANYDEPHKAMYQLLKKRHIAPQYGGHTRLAPEERDYLVMEEIPDVFHTGHVHKLGYGKYHNVLAINSGCWQEQTSFQKSVNIDPDVGYAPILDLDTLDLTIQKF
ncbi:DNA-directed DNA polymerase II small subunit [Halococcus agarilyticus]|uniref:DNA-directed DNA polymerase II small subunit n=1 Tax=Halococcus agarilyticus TaxID=1232219 RepID=UPI00067831B0|nr:DNA-directed DNA polymerase II small subunit [Halococcus agarilyticus]